MSDDLQFSPVERLSKDERARLLLGAEQESIALGHNQGAGDAAADNEDAATFRAFAKDEAKVSRPLVFPVNVSDALGAGKLPIPVDLQQIAARSSFFLVRFPFDLEPAGNYSFHHFKMRVEFNAGADAMRPKVHAIFPSSKFKELLKANVGVHVQVEPNLQFSATTGPLKGQLGPAAVSANAGASAAAKLTAGFDLPSLEFNWKKSLVTTSPTGLEWAWWDIAGAEMSKGDDLALMAIVQVPKQLDHVVVGGRITASRHYDLIRHMFRHLSNLKQAYREFVEAGLPCSSEPVDFDVSAEMASAH